jgi:hypothetical protein
MVELQRRIVALAVWWAMDDLSVLRTGIRGVHAEADFGE